MQSYKLQSMLDEYDDLLPGAPLPMTGNRQYDRKRKRMLEEMETRIENACKADYLCQAAYNMGFNRGLQRGNEFALKDGYAAALLAANEVYRFGKKRNGRLLKAMDAIVVNRLTTEELIDEVFRRFGIKIDFADPFDRVQEVE